MKHYLVAFSAERADGSRDFGRSFISLEHGKVMDINALIGVEDQLLDRYRDTGVTSVLISSFQRLEDQP